VSFDLEIEGFGPDPFRQDDRAKGARAGFTATAEIDRTDFGVGDRTTLPGGQLFLSERVQIVLEIQAALAVD
jgi:polyisoprenoid-binding protein YceI